MNIIGKSDEVFLRLGVEEMDEPRLKAEPHRRVAGVGVGVEVRGLHHGHHVLAAGGHVQMQLAAHQLAHVDLRVDALVADGDVDRTHADGHGTAVGSSMYPNFRKYFLPELADLYPHDTEKAKAMLAEAGYPDGFDLTITVPSNYQPHMDTAQVVAEQLRAIGVNVTIDPVEWASWLENVYSGRRYQATVVGVDASTLTARAMLERFTSTASNNFTNYSNAEYDEAFAAAIRAATDEEATAQYLRCEEILAETAANVYIQDLADLVAVRKGLSGYRFYPLYAIDLSTVTYT